jgi:hypothetical protein
MDQMFKLKLNLTTVVHLKVYKSLKRLNFNGVEAGSNTSTVALRVAEATKREVSNLRQ